jgi:hypothetical protein
LEHGAINFIRVADGNFLSWWNDSSSHQCRRMKITLNWLKQYVDFNWLPGALTGWRILRGLALRAAVR